MTGTAELWLWLGLALAAAGAGLVYALRQGTRTAALCGFAVAAAATLGFGPGAMLPLSVFVLGAGALTRAGRDAKARLGAGEANRGRRGAGHVAAKLGVPAILGALAAAGLPRYPLALAFSAALCGAFADTAATESGPLGRGRAFRLSGLRSVACAHGSPGGISAAGLLAGAVAAALVAVSALAPRILPNGRSAALAAGLGFAASVLESAIGGGAVGARLGHFGRNVLVSVLSAAGALLAARAEWVRP